MQAIDHEDFDSYWTETSAAEGLMEYISKDFNGMTKTIAELIGGVDVRVNTNGFANDLVTFKGKDDVLTLMIHLGYLAYNAETKTVHIPNEEIKLEFQRSIREVHHSTTLKRLEESDRLFLDTIEGNEEAVAARIEKVHREETSPPSLQQRRQPAKCHQTGLLYLPGSISAVGRAPGRRRLCRYRLSPETGLGLAGPGDRAEVE